MSGDFYSYHALAGVMACLELQKYESLGVCNTDMPKGLLKLLSHCIMLILPSSHAAELLQVAWKSLIGVGIVAGIWVLAISGARTQVRHTAIPSVCSGLHHSLPLCSERSLLFHSAYKVHWWYVFQFFLVLIISWWASPLTKIHWAPFFIRSRTSTLFLLSPGVFIYRVKVGGSGHSCLVLSSWEGFEGALVPVLKCSM